MGLGTLASGRHGRTRKGDLRLVCGTAAVLVLVSAFGCGGGAGAQSTASTTASAPVGGTATSGASGVSQPAGPIDTTGGSDQQTGANVSIVDQHDPSPLDLPSLGTVSFSLDETVKPVTVPVELTKDTVVTLTDAQGLTYELVVPAGAVARRISITMEAMKGVSSTDVPGKLVGGVIIKPDGLRFAAPATLTITGKGVGASAHILTSAEDGTGVDFAEPRTADGAAAGIAATLWHLSDYLLSDWIADPAAAYEDQVKARAVVVLEKVKAVLADPQIRVTVPPSLSLECSDEVTEMLDQQSIDLWLRSADDPETELLHALLSSATQHELLGLDNSALWDAVRKVLLRQQARAEKLIKEYANDRERMLAVGSYGLIVARNMQFVGGLEAESSALIARVGEYDASFIDGLIEDIIAKHDYKMFRPVLLVGKWANLLGITEGKFDGSLIIRRAMAAMEFKLKTKAVMQHHGIDDGKTGTWTVQSEIPVTLGADDDFRPVLSGEGSGKYISFTATGGSSFEPMVAPDFPIMAVIDPFDPCRGEATLKLDRYSADHETYGESKLQMPVVLGLLQAVFHKYRLTGPAGDLYSFPLTLNNLQINAVQETFTNQAGTAEGTFEVTLIHTPRRISQ
jgi:hypothetical protein